MPSPNNRTAIILILFFAFVLRFWGFAEQAQFIGDEFQFVPSADNFMKAGHYEPIDWLHPPLNFHLTVIGQNLFGNNPYGWRFINVVLGSLSVLMLMLLAQKLFSDKRIGWLAGLLFAIEPFHIQLSRTNFMEIPPVFFFLMFIYAIVSFLRGNTIALALSGIPLGLAISGKWYFVIPAACCALVVGLEIFRKKENIMTNVLLLLSSAVTAFGIYMLLFYPWFQRGSDLGDFFIWQFDAYRRLQTLTLDNFLDGFFRASPSVPWHWFVKPLIVAEPLFNQGAWEAFFVMMNNPPVWLLVLPAFAYSCSVAWRTRENNLILVLLLFLTTYLQFVLVKRPVFLYSSFPVLPFAYMLIARAMSELIGESQRGRHIFSTILIAILVWGIYLYPLITNRMVPVAFYQYLLPAMPLPH